MFRETADLAEDLVFYENYLGKRDATFTLNFSTGAAMVLAQYYNFVRLGHDGYRYTMETMQANTRSLAERIVGIGDFKLVGDEGAEQLPLVAFQLAEERNFDEFDVASQLAAERGWMVPAYTLPPNAEHVTIMRALVKLTLGHTLASTLADDLAQACSTLEQKGGLHPLERKRAKTGTGYAERSPSSGERLCLDRVELGLRDRAAVEQLLGLVDLGGGAAGRGDVLDVVVEFGLLCLGLPHLALGHPVAVGDQVDQHAEERQHDDRTRTTSAFDQPEMSRLLKMSAKITITIQIQITQQKKMIIDQKMSRNG